MQYQDGGAIGRACIEHYLDINYRVKRIPGYVPQLGAEEIEFLRGCITRETYPDYEPFSKLEEALVRLYNTGLCFEQTLNHALYRSLYIVTCLILEIKGVIALSASEGEPAKSEEANFRAVFERQVTMINENFRRISSILFPFALRGLYHQDYLIKQLGKVYNIDLDIMADTQFEGYERDINALKWENKHLIKLIKKIEKEEGSHNKILPQNAVAILEDLDRMKLNDFKVKRATKTQIAKFIKANASMYPGFAVALVKTFLPD